MATSSSSTSTSNSNNHNNTKKRKAARGIDTLLTIRGRPLKAGESVRFSLVKGPTLEQGGDPVDPKSPVEEFPLLAKFGESVRRPDFTTEPWKSARLYQQEVPKPVDDSDEEDGGGEEGAAQQQQPKKKRWRYGSSGDAAGPRQWILQENVDFLQTMVDRKEEADGTGGGDANNNNGSGDGHNKIPLSSRYEGTSEHNPSRYCLIQLHPSTTSPQDATLQITLAPRHVHSHINFGQPAARKTYSLTEAEHVISDQRMGLVKTLHHMLPKTGEGGGGADGGAVSGGGDGADPDAPQQAPPPRNILALRKKAAHSSKGRLLSKLTARNKAAAGDEEDGDDVMADVAFRHRKGGGGGARKELLQTAGGDGTVTVSDEGVLGGSNDAMFGGRQRFATWNADNQDAANPNNSSGGGAGGKDEDDKNARDDADDNDMGGAGAKERGADGAAMDDDFYQRDVKAEYDELDYDANEQFDDDDVDLGEAEVVVENSGFGGGDDDEDNEEEDEDEDGEAAEQGAQGLASLAGFKALLAKARGEAPPEPADAAAAAAQDASSSSSSRDNHNKNKRKTLDHMSKIRMAAEQSRLDAEQKQRRSSKNATTLAEPMDVDEPAAAPPPLDEAPAAPAAAAANNNERMVDDQGLRILSLDAIRREIWLNHGSIPMKRLMKIFDVKRKSSQERQDRFRDIVKELCTMRKDAVNGNMLVLKQHYSKG